MKLEEILADIPRRMAQFPGINWGPSRAPDVEAEDCFHRGEFLGRCTACSVPVGYRHDRRCAKVAVRA